MVRERKTRVRSPVTCCVSILDGVFLPVVLTHSLKHFFGPLEAGSCI